MQRLPGGSFNARRMASGDINGDGVPDLVIACGVFGGQQDPSFRFTNSGSGYCVSAFLGNYVGASSDVAVSDFDRNGHADVVIVHSDASTQLFLNSPLWI